MAIRHVSWRTFREPSSGWRMWSSPSHWRQQTCSESPEASQWSSAARRCTCHEQKHHSGHDKMRWYFCKNICYDVTTCNYWCMMMTYRNWMWRFAAAPTKSSRHSTLIICCFCSPPLMVASTSFTWTSTRENRHVKKNFLLLYNANILTQSLLLHA